MKLEVSLRTILPGILALLCMSGCSLGTFQEQPQPFEEQVYIDHEVRYVGETLGLISNWYTGTPNNWSVIIMHNDGLNVRTIQVGQTIRIPEQMVIRSEPLPESFLNLVYVKKTGNEKKSNPVAVTYRENEKTGEFEGDYRYPDAKFPGFGVSTVSIVGSR